MCFLLLLIVVRPRKNLVFRSPNSSHLALDFWKQRISSYSFQVSFWTLIRTQFLFRFKSLSMSEFIQKGLLGSKDIAKGIPIPFLEDSLQLRKLVSHIPQIRPPFISDELIKISMSQPNSFESKGPSSIQPYSLSKIEQTRRVTRFKFRQVQEVCIFKSEAPFNIVKGTMHSLSSGAS